MFAGNQNIYAPWKLFRDARMQISILVHSQKIIDISLQQLYITNISVLPNGRSFTANSGTKAAILPKGRSSIANSGT